MLKISVKQEKMVDTQNTKILLHFTMKVQLGISAYERLVDSLQRCPQTDRQTDRQRFTLCTAIHQAELSPLKVTNQVLVSLIQLDLFWKDVDGEVLLSLPDCSSGPQLHMWNLQQTTD